MILIEAQALIEEANQETLYIKDRILESKDAVLEEWEKRDWIIAMNKIVKIEKALNQLSAYIAEQEKAVRVKVLVMLEEFNRLGAQSFMSDWKTSILAKELQREYQKIEEAKE